MLLPAVTGFGIPELVTARSAWPAVATRIEAVAELLPLFGSGVEEAIFAVLKRTVPDGTEAGTVMTTGNVEVPLPATMEAAVHVIVPVKPAVGVVQDQPLGATKEKNVAFCVPAALLAVGSVKDSEEAVAGPLLLTTAVMVKLEPARTVGAEAVLVTARSAWPATATVVMAVAVLLARLGSVVPDVTLSTSMICVPFGVPEATVTTTVKEAVDPLATSGLLQVIGPVVTHVHPGAAVVSMEEKVVLAGMPSVKTALTASSGPLFLTVCV